KARRRPFIGLIAPSSLIRVIDCIAGGASPIPRSVLDSLRLCSELTFQILRHKNGWEAECGSTSQRPCASPPENRIDEADFAVPTRLAVRASRPNAWHRTCSSLCLNDVKEDGK